MTSTTTNSRTSNRAREDTSPKRDPPRWSCHVSLAATMGLIFRKVVHIIHMFMRSGESLVTHMPRLEDRLQLIVVWYRLVQQIIVLH
jgi:hypothetical protein